ncbi:hypothetical protein [Tahibacter amnicola]|uniref:Uncharacterized protein n=1 Tax=Tahibacter amnicola TaxID=2976241 RepID=A0ABY6BA35_9GAMM|nr:hypothetical protein [Tahibacter amnicola]UXI66923.1 hypothetical protein N4264_19515 [Tahibacter amnicola]
MISRSAVPSPAHGDSYQHPWIHVALDWALPGADGHRLTADDVAALVCAGDADTAMHRFWFLEGAAASDGICHPVGISVMRYLAAAWWKASSVARPYCLQLMAQLAIGEPAEGVAGSRAQCLAELRGCAWQFLSGLELDPDNAWHYVDLIGVLAQEFSDLRDVACTYLSLAEARALGDLRAMIRNTLEEIRTRETKPQARPAVCDDDSVCETALAE